MAGSPEQDTSAVAKTGEALDHLALQVSRTLKSADSNHVHDLRVATRRLGQAVAVLEDSSDLRGTGKIRRELKKAIRLAGPVRDYDIAAKLIAKIDAPAALKTRLLRQRRQSERALLKELRDWKDRGAIETWRARLVQGNGAAAPRERDVLRQAARRLFERGRDVNGSMRALHKMRIAAKKLRYTMELMPVEKSQLDPVRKLQSKLGDINDHETTRRIVKKEGAAKKITSALKAKQEKKVRQFRRYWKDEFAGKKKEWLAKLDGVSGVQEPDGPGSRRRAVRPTAQ